MPIYTFRCMNCGEEREMLTQFLALVGGNDKNDLVGVGSVVESNEELCKCGHNEWVRTYGRDGYARTAGRWRP